jgi:NCAIR mutase (PurE)-related protein
MHFDLKQSVRALTACVLATLFAVPQNLLAQAANHVITPSDLQKMVLQASQSRQQQVEKIREFFSSDTAQKALRSAHLKPEQVKNAVSRLNDSELEQLASRVEKTQADFAAGNFSDRDLILVILAIAALILIIVAVR